MTHNISPFPAFNIIKDNQQEMSLVSMFLDNNQIKEVDQSSFQESFYSKQDQSSATDGEEGSHKIKSKRNGKGLKLLSVMVRDIVQQQKNVTYKEVAELIL